MKNWRLGGPIRAFIDSGRGDIDWCNKVYENVFGKEVGYADVFIMVKLGQVVVVRRNQYNT